MENNVEYPPANYPLRLYGASYNKQVVRVTTPKYKFRKCYWEAFSPRCCLNNSSKCGVENPFKA